MHNSDKRNKKRLLDTHFVDTNFNINYEIIKQVQGDIWGRSSSIIWLLELLVSKIKLKENVFLELLNIWDTDGCSLQEHIRNEEINMNYIQSRKDCYLPLSKVCANIYNINSWKDLQVILEMNSLYDFAGLAIRAIQYIKQMHNDTDCSLNEIENNVKIKTETETETEVEVQRIIKTLSFQQKVLH